VVSLNYLVIFKRIDYTSGPPGIFLSIQIDIPLTHHSIVPVIPCTGPVNISTYIVRIPSSLVFIVISANSANPQSPFVTLPG
jgi:hypothetical protein